MSSEGKTFMFDRLHRGTTLSTANNICATDPNTGDLWAVASVNSYIDEYAGEGVRAAFEDRLMDSYNALAGMNPAALGDLVEAARAVSDRRECDCFGIMANDKHCLKCDAAFASLSTALRALDGEDQ